MNAKKILIPITVLLLLPLLWALSPASSPSQRSRQPVRIAAPGQLQGEKTVTLTLSEGSGAARSQAAAPVTVGSPLSVEQARELLQRLPADEQRPEVEGFAFRDRSLPAPRPGETIATPFPPDTSRRAPETDVEGPLEVLRFAPEGQVDLAGRVSITFSQPMVPLAAHDELAAEDLPVTMTPQPEGNWRWLGTRTLVFESGVRLPGATAFKVSVPADTASYAGTPIEAPADWSFTTPPPRLVNSSPGRTGTYGQQAVIYLEFDQRIEPDRVLPYIEAAAGRVRTGLRLASADEIEADERTKRLKQNAPEGRHLFAVPQSRLAGGANVTVTLKPGLPSAEGPLTTTEAQDFSFSVYGEFKVTGSRCGWDRNCRPGHPLRIMFSNAVDTGSFKPSMVTIEPAVPGIAISPGGNSISLQGLTKARTNYTVTVSADLKDVFGQTLGNPATLNFDVGADQERLFTTGGNMVVLDPAAAPQYSVFSVNHQNFDLQIYKVGPEHWDDWLEINGRPRNRGGNTDYPGEKLFDDRITIDDQPDQMVETVIDLAKYLDGGFGHLIVAVRPTKTPPNQRYRQQSAAWVQATHLGIAALADAENLIVWADNLADGKALDNITFELTTIGGKTISSKKADADGIVRLPLADDNRTKLLLARRGNDLAMLPERIWYSRGGSSWTQQMQGDQGLWYTFDDRGMYRPGETAHVKGWLRVLQPDDKLVTPTLEQVNYSVNDARGNRIVEGTAPMTAAGGFHFTVDLPDEMNLGRAMVTITGGRAGRTRHMLNVQEFRRPKFEVSVQTEAGPHLLGKSTQAEVHATYYAGGNLNGAQADWTVRVTDTQFTPPNRGEFQFGTPTFSFFHHIPPNRPAETFNYRGVTGSDGKHKLRLGFDDMKEPKARNLAISVGVSDIDNQRISGSANMILHPAEHYVGVRSQRYFVEKGKPLDLQFIVCDINGKAVTGSDIQVTVARKTWHWKDGAQEKTLSQQSLKSAADPLDFSVETRAGGTYVITAEVRDAEGRLNRTRVTRWVSGGKMIRPERVDREQVQLIPDKETYQPGDLAEILIQAPFNPARGMISIRRGDIVESKPVEMSGPTYTLRLPIEDAHIPNLNVVVDLNGATTRNDSDGRPDETLPMRPAYASGSLALKIPPLKHGLEVTLTPDSPEPMPGEETEIEVTVTGKGGGARAGAEIAVWVVDEAVLSLSNYKLGDPLNIFYPQRADRTRGMNLRPYLLLRDPKDLMGANEQLDMAAPESMVLDEATARPTRMRAMAPQAAPMSALKAAAPGAPQAEPIAVRTNFDALAAFFPEQPTGKNGSTRVKLKLPDNLTRYRILAVAVDGNRFGTGEATMTARLPLMVRPAPPRFLNFGDRFDLAVMLQNQTDAPLEVALALEAANAELLDGAGKQVTVPANDRVRVNFKARAAEPGTARFRVAASTQDFADAAAFEIPVWTPATTEAFATYGTLDEGSTAQPVRVPTDIHPQVGGLNISTSSTALHALSDAVIYLNDYPFKYPEPLASRILSLAALHDVMTAFGAELDPNEAAETMKRDIQALARLQNPDGGFGFWRRDNRSSPYLTVHVAHAVARAALSDQDIPAQMEGRLNSYLGNIARNIPSEYADRVKLSIEAYALYVQNLTGKANTGRAKQLMKRLPLKEIPLDALGRLLPMLDGDDRKGVFRHLLNRVEETAAAASFTGSYGDGAYLILHSNRVDDALVLEGLIATDPESDLIPKLVAGLMGGRTAGRWSNTQENVFILLALNKYFRTYEAQDPDFVARIWLGEGYAGEHAYRGRSTDRNQLHIPMTWLVDNAMEPSLIMAREGEGRMYYRLGMSYAPANLELDAAGHGFFVERRYEAVNDPDDVRRDDNGSWLIRAGADVRVVVEMVAPGRRNHVALVDQLPAGLEPVEVEQIRPDMGRGKAGGFCILWWPRPWYDHHNLRDERVEAVSTSLWPGVHRFSYIARATTTGDFVVPPAKAEEMYNAETFGRTGSDRVVIQ
ncbi:MAG: alpha-2-macroglobulin family protein [Acidobacteriota bacterium]|nr:alpha-2-macroglobulin family protein [Acidobacteriota bacterium]